MIYERYFLNCSCFTLSYVISKSKCYVNVLNLFRLNQMLYALCLSYHSNKKAGLFAVFSQVGPPQRVDCLALSWHFVSFPRTSDAPPYRRESKQGSATRRSPESRPLPMFNVLNVYHHETQILKIFFGEFNNI